MRISTNQIFDGGTLGILRNQSDLYKLQNQMSTGRRILTPADDPVAAAQAVVVSQSKSVNEQRMDAQSNAKSQLATVEGQLNALTDLLQNVRERIVQAGNATLTYSDKQSLAVELQARLDQMKELANSDDGTGQYLFSGFQGSTRPFAVDPITGTVAYYGDSGERLLQVDTNRQMSSSVAGDDLFMRVKNGNGSFQVTTGGAVTMPLTPPLLAPYNNGVNQGTATVDGGSVTDINKWRTSMANAALWTDSTHAGDLRIVFSVTGTLNKVTTYQIYDNSDPANPVALLAAPANYTPGQTIPLVSDTLPADFGANVMVDGEPEDGDSFTISQSVNQSMFATLENLIAALQTPTGGTGYTPTEYYNAVSRELVNTDQAIDNVNRIRSLVGSRLNDLDSLDNVAQDSKLQYEKNLSDLQDIDYASAISDLMRRQMQLEAAQASFSRITGLSLFNYI